MPWPRKWIIAVDGPAGAGKSTIAKAVAHALRYKHVDSGAMYRAVAWKALRDEIPLNAPRALTALAKKIRLDFRRKKGASQVRADGVDVTEAIRLHEVGRAASAVATIRGVRKILVARQKAMGRKGGVVMEGRDIGAEVFPEAHAKFFLDASAEERSRRRYRELKAKGKKVIFEAILDGIQQRDLKDRTRKESPLRAAEDAVVIDTTGMTQARVRRAILGILRKKTADGRRDR